MQKGSQHPFTPNQHPATEYLVLKKTRAVTTCPKCAGVGCPGCVNGKLELIHDTEVDLITALKELNLIK